MFQAYLIMPNNPANKKLADLIESNPECIFEIEEDIWYMVDKNGNEITNSGYLKASIMEALAELLNRKNFNITFK